MDTDSKNYYQILEIPMSATPQEIDKAYTRAKNAYSGDSVALYSLLSTDECSQILTQIEEAYSILGFPEKRREYDRIRGFNLSPRNPFDDDHHPVAPQVQRQFEHQPTVTPERPMREDPTPMESTRPNFQYEDYGSNIQEAKVSKVQALKKFGLDYEVDTAMEQKIEQAIEFRGPFLKEIREYKRVPMERMVEMTRISRTHIDAIETENLTKLPADVYTRGFVSQYAKVLKLNPELVATSYLHHIKRLKGGK